MSSSPPSRSRRTHRAPSTPTRPGWCCWPQIDGVTEAEVGEQHESVDPSRRLYDVTPIGEAWQADVKRAYEFGALATAAQLVGAAEALLNAAVDYAKQRSQFGRVIGSYQAIKHKLADVHIAIELARPLVYGAALDQLIPAERRDVSAAKAAASEAALLAARASLQTHGAIGFTQEHDLSLWLLRVQALRSAWGTPEAHRRRCWRRCDPRRRRCSGGRGRSDAEDGA